ncbi:uncharacterized protein LOC131946315 [Physella acuta]|uniref:uncharacterized protein LOC131946315 n=1 Tax=Physella acuta TaxID=109671 RepID=UPI0027DAD425|nr:uncharacterized protein LOC131946315 [Physella acuta]
METTTSASLGLVNVLGLGPDVVRVIVFTNQFLCGVISFLGVIANVINTLVYYKQGLDEPVSISLLALSLSDLVGVVTSLWVAVCWNPLVYYADLPFVPADVEYLTGSLPHLVFTRITGWITAFVAVERCLCVALPFDVKSILTPSKVKVILACVFVVVAGAHVPSFCTSGLAWVYVAGLNRTVVALVTAANKDQINSVTYSANLVSPFGSFLVVLLATAVTAYQLTRASERRLKSISGQRVTLRDRKTVKMVVTLSVIFILSYLPTNVLHVFYCSIAGRAELLSRYTDLISLTFSFIKPLEAFNASIGILLYWRMSSRFKATVTSLFATSK